MKLNLQIEFSDGTEKTVTTSTADLVAFEDKYEVSVAQLGRDTRISWLLYLAWHAEKRTGSTKLPYEKWVETVDGIGDSETAPK